MEVLVPKQSRLMSFLEASANVVVGFALALLTQLLLFPLFSISLGMNENLIIGGVFTAVSLLRSYALRRLFEALRAGERMRWRSYDGKW
jgi:hypothetical protein